MADRYGGEKKASEMASFHTVPIIPSIPEGKRGRDI